jgi:hypothetical protein
VQPNQPDTERNENTTYKADVFDYLNRNHYVASKDELRQQLDIPDWYIEQIASSDTFYTSLTHNGRYVASKYLIGRRADRQGFWRPSVADGEAVFHREGTTKATLKNLTFRRPSGLTPSEAADLLGRDCYKALKQLVEVGEIKRVELGRTIVYTHRWPSRREKQVTARKTDERVDLNEPSPPVEEFLLQEDLLEVFIDAAEGSIESAPIERVAACLIRQRNGDSFAALETRLHRNHSLQDALGYAEPAAVDDATTLWRAFDALTTDELQNCLHALTSEVLERTNAGEETRVLTVDGTHVEAWANTRVEIEDGEVEGAAWGKHEGWFYGYQVMLLVDPVEELPLALMARPGNEAEKTLFVELCEEFTDRFDPEDFDCEAVFADAEYDTAGCREAAEEILEAPLNTGINPRRSKPLKALKKQIKALFEKHGQAIETPYDALERLPQTLLSDYGVELGSVEESYIYRAIKERMNRHVRSAVERTIGRLKEFAGMNEVRARKESNAHTHILLSGVLLAAISVTAISTGKPANRRSPTVI